MPDDERNITPDVPHRQTDISSESTDVSSGTVRPTKKQQELLEYIRLFIIEHGYGPSYREIMNGCNYTSVATVAVHIQNLITRGHLRKNGRSARSLEIVGETISTKPRLPTNEIKPAEEKWLVDKVDYIFAQIHEQGSIAESDLRKLQTLVDALNVLGLNGASLMYAKKLNELKSQLIEE